MTQEVEKLSTAAALHGAGGVLAYLQDNRQYHRELLDALGSPALLASAGHPHGVDTVAARETKAVAPAPDVGLCIETLAVHIQREIWCAFLQNEALLPVDTVHKLTARFLMTTAARSTRDRTKADETCMYLASLLNQRCQQTEDEEREGEEDGDGDAVETALARLAFLPSRAVAFPVAHQKEDKAFSKKRPRSEEVEEDYESAVPSRDPPQQQEVVATVQRSGMVAAVTVTLPVEIETRVLAIAKQLTLLGSPDVSADQASKAPELAVLTVEVLRQVMNKVHATQQDNEALFRLACITLQLPTTSDDALFQLTSGLMDANWSSRYAGVYLETAVVPRILNATSVISRVLLQTTLLFAKPSYTHVLMDRLLVPLVTTRSIGPSQGEAVTRMLREKCVPLDQLVTLLQRSLQPSQLPHLLTNEATILVFQNVLNMKPVLSSTAIELLVTGLAGALDFEPRREQLLKSAKFATLLFTLVSKYSAQCKSHVDELNAVASQLSSVMAKATVRAIQRLQG